MDDQIRIWKSTFLYANDSKHISGLVCTVNTTLYPQWMPVPMGNTVAVTLIFSGLPKDCKSIDSSVSPEFFFRISRKVILHIDSIKKVSPNFNSQLKLSATNLSEADAVVSRERVSDFKSWLYR